VLAAGALLLCLPSTAVAGVSGGPVNLTPPTITGNAVVGETVSCSQGTWAGVIDSYAYQWNRGANAISGATGTSYAIVADDVGQLITCTVTATDFAGSSTATSSPVVPTAGGGGGSGSPGTPGIGGVTPLPDAATVIEFPPAKKSGCASRRKFRIRIRQIKNVSYKSASVFVNGKQAKVVKGARLTAPVDLRGLPKGSFTAKIVVTTDDGRTLSGKRKYKTCASKRGPKGKKRRL
jgi:hypothetical protein